MYSHIMDLPIKKAPYLPWELKGRKGWKHLVATAPRAAGSIFPLSLSIAALPLTTLPFTVTLVIVALPITTAFPVLAVTTAWTMTAWSLLTPLSFTVSVTGPGTAAATASTALMKKRARKEKKSELTCQWTINVNKI